MLSETSGSLFAVYGGEWIASNSGYPSELIDAFCQSTGVGKRTLFRVLLSRLRLFAAGFLYEEKYKKDVKIVPLFKIPGFPAENGLYIYKKLTCPCYKNANNGEFARCLQNGWTPRKFMPTGECR